MNKNQIIAAATKGPNYALAGRIAEGCASDEDLRLAAVYIARGVKAAPALQAALDLLPVGSVVQAAPAPVRTKATTAAPVRKGADPIKAKRARVATEVCAAKGSAEWWAAYKATRGCTTLVAMRAAVSVNA